MYLVTGVAGFIGMHTARKLLEGGNKVVGIDNLDAYYDVSLKKARLAILNNFPNFDFKEVDIRDKEEILTLFSEQSPSKVIHLAAQAGVRYSLENPNIYIESNILGFTNILEGCRATNVDHLVYASSSSVYGGNEKLPFSEHNSVDHPVSLYAATKKANELMAHTYSHLYNIATTGLRFFTVYGPWGRPDMALFIFTKSILEGRPIQVFNNGEMIRDFTYVDDIAEGILRVAEKPAIASSSFDPLRPDPACSAAPYRVFNIGNGAPVFLTEYISAIEKALKKDAVKEYWPMQPGDVAKTHADTEELVKWVDFKPATTIQDGIDQFVMWYQDYYEVT